MNTIITQTQRYLPHTLETRYHANLRNIICQKYFGYKPEILQTDNGAEFTHFKDTKCIHPLDTFFIENGIEHKLIRPRIPCTIKRFKEAMETIIRVFTNIFLFIFTMT